MSPLVDGRYDVIVVGAGPAGTACSTLLARHDLRVLLLDKARFPREKICGDCINPKCWPIFELLGVASTLRQQGFHVIDSFRLTNNAGIVVRGKILPESDSPLFSIKRSILDALLLENAARSGANVLEKTAVVDVQWSAGRDVVVRTAGENRFLEFRADYLVGADGRNSLVAKKILEKDDIPQERHGERRISDKRLRVGVQWHTHHQPQAGSAVEFFLFASGYCGIVNVDDRAATVAMVTTPDLARLGQHDFPRFLEKTLYSNPAARMRFPSLTPPKVLSTAFPIHPRLHDSGERRVFLIGDARQTVEPFTGEGVFFAMQEGVLAAQRILHEGNPPVPFLSQSIHTPSWTNRVSTLLLSHGRCADLVTVIASRLPFLVPFVTRAILR